MHDKKIVKNNRRLKDSMAPLMMLFSFDTLNRVVRAKWWIVIVLWKLKLEFMAGVRKKNFVKFSIKFIEEANRFKLPGIGMSYVSR